MGAALQDTLCMDCDKTYTGKIGSLFHIRLEEHQKEVNSAPQELYTGNTYRQSEDTTNKSAITDQAIRDNHILHWQGAEILDKFSGSRKDTQGRQFKYASPRSQNIGMRANMCKLSHIYDDVIQSRHHLHWWSWLERLVKVSARFITFGYDVKKYWNQSSITHWILSLPFWGYTSSFYNETIMHVYYWGPLPLTDISVPNRHETVKINHNKLLFLSWFPKVLILRNSLRGFHWKFLYMQLWACVLTW